MAAVVLLAGILRIYALGSVPPGINQDEAVHAYEAWSLRTTGKDHMQNPWPIFFRAFGWTEHHSAPFMYMLIPLQTVFGMNVWTTRLPGAILGTLNVWFLYLLVRRLYGGRAGLLAALMLAISPWGIHLSRLAFEVSVCPPLLTLALLLIAQASGVQPREPSSAARGGHGEPVRRRAFVQLAAAGFLLGLVLWTYNAYRAFLPLLLMGAAVLYAGNLYRFARRPGAKAGLLLAVACFAVAVAPFVWASIYTHEKAWGHAKFESLLDETKSPLKAAKTILRTYCLQLSPVYLFISGDPYPIQSVPGYGQLNHYLALLLPLGIYRAVRRGRQERFGWLLLWWLLAAPIPAALTHLSAGHCLRTAGALPAYQIVGALGLDMLLAGIARRRPRLYAPSVAAACVAMLLNGSVFACKFFVKYPIEAAPCFQVEWIEACTEVRERQKDYDAVMLTWTYSKELGIIYLFWNRIPPQQFFADTYQVETSGPLDVLVRSGKVFFISFDFIDQLLPGLPPKSRVLVAERPDVPVPGTELKRIYFPDGVLALILYDVPVQGQFLEPGAPPSAP